MCEIERFTVTIYFSNGITIQKEVPLKRAISLAMRDNVIADDNAELYDVRGIVIPEPMIFIVSRSPEFKTAEFVNRRDLYERDGGRCSYCGEPLSMDEATIDHIKPKAQGGKNTWKNVALSCQKCNWKKADKTPAEAGMKLRIKPTQPKKKSVLRYNK